MKKSFFRISTLAICSLFFTVQISAQGTADFSADITFGCAPLEVHFSDSSTTSTGIDSWFWDFGDGDTSHVQNPVHEYIHPGQYTVIQIVVFQIPFTTFSDTLIKTNYIEVTRLEVSDSITDASCNNADGIITLNVSGGTPPYYVMWSNGDSTLITDNLAAGAYTVVIEDSSGCRFEETYQVHSSNNNLSIAGIVMNESALGANDGSIDVTVSGGTPPYSYHWVTTGDSTEDLTNLEAGTYCLLVTDSNGCIEDACFDVEGGCANFSVIEQVTHIGCNGTPAGAITLTVSGGVEPYYFLWSTGDSTKDITGLTAGVYTVVVEDSSNCRHELTYTVGFAGGFQISGTVTNATGSLANGSIAVAVNGGTPPYEYSWDGGNTYNFWHVNDSLVSGNYCVLVRDSNSCIEDLCFVVGNDSCHGLNVTAWNDIHLCDTGVFILEANAFDGTEPYDYAWNPASVLTSPNNRITSGQITQTTTFQITVTDSAGCTATDEVIVFVNQGGGNFSVDFDSVSICRGDTVQIRANGGLSYSWSPATNISDPHNNDPLVYPHVSTTYSVVIEDSFCRDELSVFVAVNENCVWPGDANSDGVADNDDVLAIGIAFGINGLTRPNASLIWESQYAPDWLLALASGANLKHVDCNGDGTIDHNDTTAVSLNYGMTHNKQSFNGNQATDPELYFEIPLDTTLAGTEIDIPIYLGRDTLPVSGLYGIAFSVEYDNSIVKENTMSFSAVNSWVGNPGNAVLAFDYDIHADSKFDVALTRINQMNASGFGIIGILSFTMKDDISGKQFLVKPLQLSFSDVNAISNQENDISIFYEPSTVYVAQEITGLSEVESISISIFPNPAQNNLYINIGANKIKNATILNMLGQNIEYFTEAQLTDNQLDINDIPPGQYIIQLYFDKAVVTKKITIIK